MIYRRLTKQIRKTQPKTITVDVFDTLLLRRNRGEKWRFWQSASRSAAILTKAGLPCTRLLYFELRISHNTLLRQAALDTGFDREASLDLLNASIITDLARRTSQKLSKAKLQKIVANLAVAELEYEQTQLRANRHLIKVLAKSKLPTYFISDMYLSSQQISQLIKHFQIKVIKGGLSSSEAKRNKASGGAYELACKKFKIDPRTNLHIGDHKHTDVAAPRALGWQAFWLRLPLHRAYLHLTRGVLMAAIKSHLKHERRKAGLAYRAYLRGGFDTKAATVAYARNAGRMFGPSIIHYCNYLQEYALGSGKRVVFVSSESLALDRFCQELGFAKSAKIESLGRGRALRAYCYVLHQQGISYMDCLRVVKKVQRRKSSLEALITLGIISPNTKLFHLVGRRSIESYLQKNDKTITHELKKSYQSVVREFSIAAKTKDLTKVILADVGWNSTIEILLGEILSFAGYRGELRAIYLGHTGSNVFSPEIRIHSHGVIFQGLQKHNKYLYQPELWESWLNLDNSGHPLREAILDGVSETIGDFRASEMSSETYFKSSYPQLYQSLRWPSRPFIATLAQLKFDYGTGGEVPVPIVNITHRPWFAYRLLVRDRARFKSFYHDQAWKWGTATWYGWRWLYILWRLKSRKPSF